MTKKCKIKNCALFKSGFEVPYLGTKQENNLLLVGESPSYQDERIRVPFSDESGKLLRDCFSFAKLDWPSFLKINAVRCRVDKTLFSVKEISTILYSCRPKVEFIINKTKPKLIVVFGDIALRQILKKSGITKNRGSFVWSAEFNCWIFPTYHPKHIFKKNFLKPRFISDLQMIKDFIDNDFKPKILVDNTEYIDVDDQPAYIKTFELLITKCANENIALGIDTETQGVDTLDLNFVFNSYSVSEGTGLGWQIRLWEEVTEYEPYDRIIQWPRLPEKGRKKVLTNVYIKKSPNYDRKLALLKIICESKNIKKYVMTNFDLHVFNSVGIINTKSTVDIQSLSSVIDENLYTDATLADLQIGFTDVRVNYKNDFNKTHDKADMLHSDKKDRGGVTMYACRDADITRQVGLAMRTILLKDKKLLKYATKFTIPVTKILYKMERIGVCVDKERLPETTKEIQGMMNKAKGAALKNIPKKIKERHFDKGLELSRDLLIQDTLFHEDGFKLEPIKKTKTGYSIDKETRQKLLDKKIPKLAYNFIINYEEWSKCHTLVTRYLAGFDKYIKGDDRIHAQCTLAVARTGRSNCIAKGTKILIVGDNNKYFHGKNIENIKEGDLVYCFNDKLKPCIRKVLWSGKTGTKKIIRIHWKSVGNYYSGYLDVTPEHGIRLINGVYVKAKNLQKNFRTLSASRSRHGSHEYLNFTGFKRMTESRFIYSNYYGDLKINECVHHKNEDHFDNRIINLTKLSNSEHGKLHVVNTLLSKASREKMIKTVKQMHRDGKYVYKNGVDNPRYIKLSKYTCIRLLAEVKGRPTKVKYDFGIFINKLKKHNINVSNIKLRYNKKGTYISKGFLNKIKHKNFYDIMSIVNLGFYNLQKLFNIYKLSYDKKWANQFGPFIPNNHKITKIEYIDKVVDVFNLEVEEHHNFIANGICVSNSRNPNLQNCPKRSNLAKKIRQLLIPKKGFIFLTADMAQSELRWIAHVAKDKEMIRVFNADEDIHTNTAKALVEKSGIVWKNLSARDVDQFRRSGKVINFGLIYGMSTKGFIKYAKMEYGMDLTYSEAEEWISTFFNVLYKQILIYHKNIIELCKRDGYVDSLLGRRRRLFDIHSPDFFLRGFAERQAINHPISSPSSDTVLLVAKEIDRENLNPEEFRNVLFIHDELIYEVKNNSKVLDYAKFIKNKMEHPPLYRDFGVKLRIPLKADIKYGYNLAELKKMNLH